MSRYKPKKQHSRKNKQGAVPKKQHYADPIWEKSPLTRKIGSRIENTSEAFQCLACDYEFKSGSLSNYSSMAGLLAYPCRDPNCYYCQCGVCKSGVCPVCGSVYVEWLSFDTPPGDIYFTSEWLNGTRTYYGTARRIDPAS